MKKYEAVFILDIRKTDDEGAAFSKEFGELVAALGGKMESTTPMGRRQFTYEINKRKELDERILRNMILVCDRPAAVEAGTVALNLE